MDDISVILSDLIGSVRHETRADAFSSIIKLIDDLDYLDGLESYYNYETGDITGSIDRIEADVIKTFKKLTFKIGLNLNTNGIYEDPRSAFVLVDSILNKFDLYEDYESLFNLFNNNESDCLRLQDMCNLMVDNPIDLTNILISMNPTLVRTLTTFFNKKIFENAKSTKEYDVKFLKYVELYPDNPALWIFVSAGQETDVTTIMDSLPYPDDLNINYLLELYMVGLAIYNVDNFDLSYANLETFLNLINVDSLPTDKILLNGYNNLCKIYGKENNQ